MLIVALNDNDTFTSLNGCQLVEIPENYLDTHEGYEPGEGTPLGRFSEQPPYLAVPDRAPAAGHYFAVVLNDGETLSDLAGCAVLDISSDDESDRPVATGRVLAQF